MKQNKVVVAILNWNGRELLEKFLPSVWEYSHQDAQIVVIDNGSTDDSIDFLKKEYPNIYIVSLTENYGFPGGYNRGLSEVEGDYYILLNSDIEVTQNWILPLIRMMEEDSSIAVCQPKLLSSLDKSMYEYAGAAGGFLDKYGYPFCRGRIFDTIEKDEGQYDQPSEIFWATGAAMFVRSDIYHSLGGLDDLFFAHMEEVDFCWRVKQKGYKVMFSPESVCYHLGGATLPKSSAKKTFLNFRNNALMLYKNLSKKEFRKIYTIRLLLDAVASFKFLLSGQFSLAVAIAEAHLDFQRKKKSVIRYFSGEKVTQVYNKSIVAEYYLKKKKFFSQLSDKDFD